jgi:hypothetical protein
MKTPFKKLKFMLTALTMLFITTPAAHSQISWSDGDDVNDETPAAPIDGFIAIALAAGAYFGVRKLRK